MRRRSNKAKEREHERFMYVYFCDITKRHRQAKEHLLAQTECNIEERCIWTLFLRDNPLISSKLSNSSSALFLFSIHIFSLEVNLLQCLGAYLSLLNLIFRLEALLLFQVGFSQLCFTESKKSWWAAQKDSNQNILVAGIVVWMVITHGTWSDTGFP
jgi:hypothetical protein